MSSEELDQLVDTVEASVKKNGADTVLTLGHLLNILKKVQRDLERDDFDYPEREF